MVDVVTRSVGDGACGPQTAPAVDDCVQQGFLPLHVEEGVLLAGEGHAGKIFGGGRGTHCDRGPAHIRIGGDNWGGQFARYFAVLEAAAYTVGQSFQGNWVVGVNGTGLGGQPTRETGAVYEGIVGAGGNDEASGNGESGQGQLGQIQTFAPYARKGEARRVQGKADGGAFTAGPTGGKLYEESVLCVKKRVDVDRFAA